MTRPKYRIVELDDGRFSVQERFFFFFWYTIGYDVGGGLMWVKPFATIDEAKQLVDAKIKQDKKPKKKMVVYEK